MRPPRLFPRLKLPRPPQPPPRRRFNPQLLITNYQHQHQVSNLQSPVLQHPILQSLILQFSLGKTCQSSQPTLTLVCKKYTNAAYPSATPHTRFLCSAIARRDPLNFSASLKRTRRCLKVYLPNCKRLLTIFAARSTANLPPRKTARPQAHSCGFNGIKENMIARLPKRPLNVNCGSIVRRSSSFRSAHTSNRATRNICEGSSNN